MWDLIGCTIHQLMGSIETSQLVHAIKKLTVSNTIHPLTVNILGM